MLAALRMHNVEPGPMLFTTHPQVFWTFIAAMYIGNVMLLVLNLPLVGVFAKVATIRPQILLPIISVTCLVGVYSVRNAFFDVWVMIAAGVVGFFLRRWGYPIAPFIIGIVLGPTPPEQPATDAAHAQRRRYGSGSGAAARSNPALVCRSRSLSIGLWRDI